MKQTCWLKFYSFIIGGGSRIAFQVIAGRIRHLFENLTFGKSERFGVGLEDGFCDLRVFYCGERRLFGTTDRQTAVA